MVALHDTAAFRVAVRGLYETGDGTLARLGAAPRRGTNLFALAVASTCALRGDPAGVRAALCALEQRRLCR